MTAESVEAAPLALDWAGWHAEFGAAVGARAAVLVGDESDVVAFDPLPTEGVGVYPAALEARIERAWCFGALRLEEGTAHAGGVDAAEAMVGVRAPGGWAEASLGRGPVRFTADREADTEDLLFTVRPAVSRAWLPLHASGGSVSAVFPGRANLTAGLGYGALTSDAPYVFVRADVFPLGALPARSDTPSATFRVNGGASVVVLDSDALGLQRGWAVDLSARDGVLGVEVGFASVDAGLDLQEAYASVDVRALPMRPVSPLLAGRVERVRGLTAEEDTRWIVSARAGVDLLERHLALFGEAHLSREEGDAAAGETNVVVLDPSVERSNDVMLLSIQLQI